MGYTVYKSGAPIKCFNAHKNWLSGWFGGREYAVNPAMPEPVLNRLVTFVDYDKEMEWFDIVLLRVGPYYIQYNRAKGINIDTGMNADLVTVTYAKDDSSDSEAIAGLAAGQQVELPGYRRTGFSLVIEVCELGTFDGSASSSAVSITKSASGRSSNSLSSFDYAWVSIYLDNGEQQSQCDRVDSPTVPDVAAVTPKPSLRPTTSPPSAIPTSEPTLQPSSQPTRSPTQSPSESSATAPPTASSPQPSSSPTSTDLISEYDKGLLEGQQEKIQKKRQIPSLKDYNKLVKDEEIPARRLRLKGKRVY
jgi:hypothetical protein